MMNGNGHDEDAAVLDELRQWRQRGAALRSKLEATRERLVAQIKEVDAALAEIAPTVDPLMAVKHGQRSQLVTLAHGTGEDWAAELRKQNLKAPDLVLAVLARMRRWMSANAILEIAREVDNSLDSTLLHSAVFRLVKSDRILARGAKGSKLYAPLGLEEARLGT